MVETSCLHSVFKFLALFCPFSVLVLLCIFYYLSRQYQDNKLRGLAKFCVNTLESIQSRKLPYVREGPFPGSAWLAFSDSDSKRTLALGERSSWENLALTDHPCRLWSHSKTCLRWILLVLDDSSNQYWVRIWKRLNFGQKFLNEQMLNYHRCEDPLDRHRRCCPQETSPWEYAGYR